MSVQASTLQAFQTQLSKITEPQTTVAPSITLPAELELPKDEFVKKEEIAPDIKTIEEPVKSEEKNALTPQKEIKEKAKNIPVENPKHKSTVKDKMAATAKVYVKTGEYFKAVGKTVVYGGIGATLVLGSSWLFGGWPKVFKKQIKASEMFSNPLKCVSTKGKVFAGITAAIIGGFQFAKAYLHANQRTANIDHKLKTEK